MKVAELARLTGVSQYALHNVYHEKTKAISFDLLEKLCQALNVSVGELIEYQIKNTAQNNPTPVSTPNNQ